MKDVTLTVHDLIKPYGNKEPLKARLTDNDTPLPNREIRFTINGREYIRITDNNGYASLNINLLAGTYPTTVRFRGDTVYNPANSMVLVRVMRTDTPQNNLKSSLNYFEVNHIPLKVLMSDGFDVKPGQNIKETTLLHDNNYNAPTFYFNSGYDGDEFEISVYMTEYYFYGNEQVMIYLNGWNKMNTVVTVVTDSMIVPNGKYTMQIKDKTQKNKEYSIWKLRFKQYYEDSTSFDSIYTPKTGSLSAIDQLLFQQRNGINNKSPKNIIQVLQEKLESIGFWMNTVKDEKTKEDIMLSSQDGPYYKPRRPNGVWDWQMQWDLYGFQVKAGLSVSKQGRCDYETVLALIKYGKTGA